MCSFYAWCSKLEKTPSRKSQVPSILDNRLYLYKAYTATDLQNLIFTVPVLLSHCFIKFQFSYSYKSIDTTVMVSEFNNFTSSLVLNVYQLVPHTHMYIETFVVCYVHQCSCRHHTHKI
jgi:hypothetical protein